ncbi:MAG: TPR repeat protein [Gammaproteobacteria bacterium]|jgi:TPR repeat protein
MGKTPKFLKPTADSFRLLLAAVLIGTTYYSAAESGQQAIARGSYGAAAAQFMFKAREGDPVAQNNLGVLYLKGRGVPQDYSLAQSWFEKAAVGSLGGAMFNLGTMYLRGYGVETDLAQSTQWFERGAAAGDREAQFFYALHLYQGRGVDQNLELAAEWFERAADQNLGSAQYNLAIMRLRGEAGPADEAAALELLNKAAAQGHEYADITIGRIHLEHSEDPDQAKLAADVFQRLAEDGNADAQVTLGMMYTFGQGNIAQDFDEGRFWLKLASNQKSGTARLNLGNIYAQGIGVERDLVRAHAWYALSAKAGDSAGESYRDTLALELNHQELEQAKLLATELGYALPKRGPIMQ